MRTKVVSSTSYTVCICADIYARIVEHPLIRDTKAQFERLNPILQITLDLEWAPTPKLHNIQKIWVII